jgi:hypothetical protein
MIICINVENHRAKYFIRLLKLASQHFSYSNKPLCYILLNNKI